MYAQPFHSQRCRTLIAHVLMHVHLFMFRYGYTVKRSKSSSVGGISETTINTVLVTDVIGLPTAHTSQLLAYRPSISQAKTPTIKVNRNSAILSTLGRANEVLVIGIN